MKHAVVIGSYREASDFTNLGNIILKVLDANVENKTKRAALRVLAKAVNAEKAPITTEISGAEVSDCTFAESDPNNITWADEE